MAEVGLEIEVPQEVKGSEPRQLIIDSLVLISFPGLSRWPMNEVFILSRG